MTPIQECLAFMSWTGVRQNIAGPKEAVARLGWDDCVGFSVCVQVHQAHCVHLVKPAAQMHFLNACWRVG